MSFEKSVFINCSVDKKFLDIFLKPIYYALLLNGYTPRCSIEISDSGEPRLEKIIGMMKECRYSIHDLSLIKAKEEGEFARMNMPFELGIDLGLRKSGFGDFHTKRFLILGAKPYEQHKALSDINGFDIKYWGGKNSTKIFVCLFAWFSDTLKIRDQLSPLQVSSEFELFNTDLFDRKHTEFGSERYAKDFITNMTFEDYKHELTKWFANKK